MSSLTLVILFNKEYTIVCSLMAESISDNADKNVLCVAIDCGSKFRQYTQDINARAKSKLNAMKALSSTSFKHSKEFLTALFKQFVYPILSYGSPSWHLTWLNSYIHVLQRSQSSALHMAHRLFQIDSCLLLLLLLELLTPTRTTWDFRGTHIFSVADVIIVHLLHEE